MATANPFDLLGDDDSDDPSLLIAAQQQKIAVKKPAPSPAGAAAAKLPSKPASPAPAVKDARSNTAPTRGGSAGGIGGGRGGPGRGRGGRGSGPSQGRGNDSGNVNGFWGGYGGAGGGGEDGDAGKPLERERGPFGGPRQLYHGGRRGGYGNAEAGGDSGRPTRRVFERHSGTGHGNELKREGSGRGNWGSPNDDVIAQEAEEVVKSEDKLLSTEKQPDQEVAPTSEANKESKDGPENKNEEKEQEDKEMTLEEYEKIREEKRKALMAMKAEERKVDLDKDFETMQQLSLKKGNDDYFVKVGYEKDSKRKDNVDRDERIKKSVSINEFLKPVDGERYYSGGRGRGRGDRGQARGSYGCSSMAGITAIAPAIDDPGHFPTLGGKQ
uniref:Plasminogen activator inhibitor 1 RNA-binding protein n=1 Tax=Anthurium amnicola TaxID=1678845 RepID=A0A1D1YJE8_9ARAE